MFEEECMGMVVVDMMNRVYSVRGISPKGVQAFQVGVLLKNGKVDFISH